MASSGKKVWEPGKRKEKVAGWIENLARAGYVAKGAVYVVVGVLALRTALGSGGDAEGSSGAIKEVGQQPFGQILLGITAIGLLGYVVWRLVQAFLDPEHKGHDVKGLVMRAAYFVSALTYLGLAFLAARIAFGWGGGGSEGRQQAMTAELLAKPYGPWLVGLVGLVILGVGVAHFYRAYEAKFMKRYRRDKMSQAEIAAARRIGQFGLAARGVTFCIIGVFFIQAARQSDPSEARGLEGALQALSEQTYGPWLLGIVAVGFVAYGIYCFSRARYRRVEPG